MELIIHPEAAKDARKIAAKYAEVSGKLVDRFWSELDSAIDGISSFPERCHYDPSGLRRSNLVKFPYHSLGILDIHHPQFPDCMGPPGMR